MASNWIYAPADGIVGAVAPPGSSTGNAVQLENPELRRTLVRLRAEEESLGIEARRARAEAPRKADALGERQRAVAKQMTAISRGDGDLERRRACGRGLVIRCALRR